jgi:hypothetical protein
MIKTGTMSMYEAFLRHGFELLYSHFVVMTGEYESQYQIFDVRALTVNPPKIGL